MGYIKGEEKMVKCELCNTNTSKTFRIRNKITGKELDVCLSCAVRFGFIAKPFGTHWECKYCDYTRGVPYPDEPDFLVCGRCGAEWEDCKILVSDGE